jgi:hypothetical protein
MDELSHQLNAVRSLRTEARRRRFRRSRLDRYRAELSELAARGASWRDLAVWLRKFKRVKVHPSTIGRRLQWWSAPGSALPSPSAD